MRNNNFINIFILKTIGFKYKLISLLIILMSFLAFTLSLFIAHSPKVNAQSDPVMCNKLGSDFEVTNSTVGEDGEIFGTSHAYEPAQHGNGYIRKATGNNYLKFPNSVVDNLRYRGSMEIWIVSKVSNPVPYQYGFFALIGSSTAPQYARANVYLYWGDGVTGNGIFGGIKFDGTVAETPSEPSQYVATIGEPFHVAISWDINGINGTSNKVRVYRDGLIVGSTDTSWNPEGTDLNDLFFIGSSPDSQGYDKFISDNIKVWDYAKTDFSDRFVECPYNLDYGDAPDPTYPTLEASTGAQHVIDNSVYLGSSIDEEIDGQPDANALGDDNDGNDDEDGVILPLFFEAGLQSNIDVEASVQGNLSAWIDWNQDGDWDEQGEQVFADEPLSAGTNNLSVNAPVSSAIGNTYARFRFSSGTGLTYTGIASDGEVEDYKVRVVAYDYGDAPDPTYPTLEASTGAKHIIDNSIYLGTGIDDEIEGQQDTDALGDDNDGNDDEDGVVFTSPIIAEQQTSLEVTASAPGNLSAWIDFNADGDWEDPDEQIFTDQVLALGINPLNFIVPETSLAGDTYARFRFSTDSGLTPQGAATDGEVEDYLISIRELVMCNKLGSDFEVTNSTVGEDGMIFGTEHAYEPAQHGNGYIRKATGNNYLKFPNSIFDNLRYSGSMEIWIVSKVSNPVPYQYGFFALIGSPTAPQYGRANVYLYWGDGVTGNGIFGGIKFDGTVAETPSEPSQYVATIGEPFHVAISWDINGINGTSDKVRVYRDGVVVGSTDASWNPEGTDLTDLFFIGSSPDSQGYDKFISDNIKVWDYAKTDFSDRFVECAYNLDYGDAPDPMYPTLEASTGAQHVIDNSVYLGSGIDEEIDGQPDANALGDDDDGNDDEDGVILPPFFEAGLQSNIDVEASVQGNLSAWIDWNQDGDWEDQGEQVFADEVLNPGTNNLNLSVPETSATGETYTRFRFSSDTGLTYTGLASDGEVEDYKVRVVAYDYGDAPDPTYPTLEASTGAKHVIANSVYLGASIDRETDGQQDPDALGDDNDGNDDEDGISFNSPIPIGLLSYLDVESSSAGNLSAWIDFNADGDWEDLDEQIFTDESLSAGINPLSFNVPASAIAGDTHARFRFSTDTGLSYSGQANDGEVEDYKVTIIQPVLTLTIMPPLVSETGGSSTTTGTITRNSGTIGDLIVNLISDDITEATVPATVTIPDGFGTATFTITGVDDSIADGTKTANITISAPGFEEVTDFVYVADNELQELTLSIDPTSISENGGTAAGTVSRNTEDNSAALTVNLTSDDESEATVPLNAEIPAGQESTTFTITARDDSVRDGIKTVTITSSASGFIEGVATVDVTDDEPIPALSITTVVDSAPEGGQLQYTADIDQVADYDVVIDYFTAGVGLNPTTSADFAGGGAGQVTITAGGSDVPINLDILADGLEEYEEDLVVMVTANPTTSGSVTYGTLWATGRIINLPAQASQGSIPADGETGVSATQKISWMPEIDPENDPQTYDLYMGTDPVPTTLLATGLTDNFYQITLLDYNTTYYWRVDIKDHAGNLTTGSIWSFTTETSVEAECPGIICNPSFEFGTVHWTPFGDTNMTLSTDSYDGLSSLSSEQLGTTGNNPKWAGFSQNITGFAGGVTYNLQLYAKGTNIAQGHIKIKWYDSGANLINTTYPLTGIEGTLIDWTWYKRIFTVPYEAVTAEFIVWHGVTAVGPQNSTGSTLMVDKIIWQPATEYCGTICNENFEAGLLFWTQQGKAGSNTVEIGGAKDGTRSVRSEQLYTSTDPVQWAGIRQTAEVTEGQTYNLRMWFKTQNAESGHVRLTWKDSQGTDINTIYPITGLTGTVGTWFKKETTVTPPANTAKAEIVIIHGVNLTAVPQNFAGSTIWIDNITMVCDQLCNGGFENGMNDWTINNYKDVNMETTDVQEGTQSVELLQDATNSDMTQWSGISQRLMVSGGNTYDLSLWLKKLNAVGGHVKITWRDTDDNFISNSFPSAGIEGTDLNWTQYTAQLTAPANADTAEIFIWHGVRLGTVNMTASRLWVDDVQFN